jgi:hypothetical protein
MKRFQLLGRKKIWIPLVLVFVLGITLLSLTVWGRKGVERYVKEEGEKILRTRFEFSGLDLNLPLGQVILHGVRVFHPDRPGETIGEVEEMSVRLRSLTSIFQKDKPIEINLRHPKSTLGRSGLPAHSLLRGGGDWPPQHRYDFWTGVEFRDGRVGRHSPSRVQFKADHWQLPTPEDPCRPV